jgi:hypothetical protein
LVRLDEVKGFRRGDSVVCGLMVYSSGIQPGVRKIKEKYFMINTLINN